MRVASYTQASAATRGSVIAVLILILTVVLGSSALHTLMSHFVPQLHQSIALLWLLTYVACFFGLMFSHGINWISWLARYRILLVILLLGTTASVSWSLDAAISAERVVHLLGSSIIAIYLGFMVPLLTILRVSAVVLGVIMFACIAAAHGMPGLGMQEYEGQIVWSGILNSKNALGFWAAVSVLLYITLSDSCQSIFMRMVCYLMALVSLYVLVMSHSATSLLAMVVAGAVSLYIYIAFRFQLGFVRMVVLALLFAGLVGFALGNIDTAELVGRTNDLTGRGEVWRQTWKLIMEKPVTGYGYGSIWFPNDATLWIQQSLTDFTWVVYHAHNGFLQVASEIGLPLSCIALLMVVQQLIEIFYCQYERQQVGVLFVLAFVLAFLISNFSEARFLVNRELYWIFFLALPISMLRQITLISQEEHSEPATGPYGYSPGHVPDKPWLRPVGNTASAATGGTAHERIAAPASPATGAAATLAIAGKSAGDTLVDADIDLGGFNDGEFDVDDADLHINRDRTLDNSDDEHPLDIDDEYETAEFVASDRPESADDIFEEDFDGDLEDDDRFEKSLDKSFGKDDDYDWIDIPLDDNFGKQ